VLESRRHAEARGATIYATIDKVASSHARRRDDALQKAIAALVASLGADGPALVVSAASGAPAATAAEKAVLDAGNGLAYRGVTSLTGHLKEAQFPFAVAVAAMALKQGAAYPPFDAASEPAISGAPEKVVATTVGYHQFEGAALLSKP